MRLWYQMLVRCVMMALAFAGSAARAQAVADSTWDPNLRRQVQAVLDSAAAQGLPVTPLSNRVLEAKARHTAPERLLEVLRAHADSMRATRALLSGATPTEIDAGATALRGGVTRSTLRRVRDARTAGQGAVAMLVLADLVRRGVPLAEAERAVLTLARRQDDGVLMELQQTFAREREAPTAAALDRIVQKLERRATPPVRPPDSACCAPLPHQRGEWLAVSLLPDSLSGREKTGVHAQAGAYVGSLASTRLWALGETSTGADHARWRLGVAARHPFAESSVQSLTVRAGVGVASLGAFRAGGGPDSLNPSSSGVKPQVEGSVGLAGEWMLPSGFSLHATGDLRRWRATQLRYGQVGSRPVILIDSTSGKPVSNGASVPTYGYRQLQASRTASIASVGLGWRGTLLEMEGGRASSLTLASGGQLSPWVLGWRATQRITPSAAMVVEFSPTPEPQLWNAGDLGASRFRVGLRLLRASDRRPSLGAASPDHDLRFSYTIRTSADTSGSEVEVHVYTPNARLVEVDGDLTAWQPRTMEREGAGRFRGRFPVPKGLARVRLRVDGGAWFAPPGLPSVPDDAGGVLGVIPGR